MVDVSLGLVFRFLRLALTALMSGDGLSWPAFNALKSEALQVILHVSSVMSFQFICMPFLQGSDLRMDFCTLFHERTS